MSGCGGCVGWGLVVALAFVIGIALAVVFWPLAIVYIAFVLVIGTVMAVQSIQKAGRPKP